MEAQARKTKKLRAPLSTFTGLGISILVHLIIFMFVGSVVIFEGKVPPIPFLGGVEEPAGGFDMEEPMPLLEEEPINLQTDIPESELLPPSDATQTTEIATSSIDVITAATTSPAFNMPTGVGGPSINTDSLLNKSFGRKMPSGPGGGGRGAKTLFGFTESFGGAMEGTMFDFKQDDDGKPTGMSPAEFGRRIQEFAAQKKWDIKDLDDYYEVEKKLYATHFYIPFMQAAEAPKAFDVADKVQPKMWMILYKGTCMAPKSDSYRFWGFADDFLYVKINGKLVFDGAIDVARSGRSPLMDVEVHNFAIGNGKLISGEWFKADAGEVLTIEAILAEEPGGQFMAYLFIEEKGKSYDMEGHQGAPVLPLFQTVEVEVDEFKDESDKRKYPKFLDKGGLFGR